MKKSKAWIIVFIILFITPHITFGILKPFLDNEDYEKRAKAELPKFNKNTYEMYGSLFEDFYSDNLPYRNELIQMNSLLSMRILGESSSKQVILGEEGWIFYKEGITDYKGINHYSEDMLVDIEKNLEKSSRYLEEKDIQFFIMVCPNKETVYKSYIPDYIKCVSEKTKTDLLIDFLEKNTELNILYPKEELCNLAEEYQLYYKNDTHWNNLGAYVGVQQIRDEICGEREYIEQQQIDSFSLRDSQNIDRYDLAQMINLKNWVEDDREYNIRNSYDVETFDYEKEYYHNTNAMYEKTVLVLGDSFSDAMKPEMTKLFSEVIFLKHGPYEEDIVQKYNPDIVILEIVERYSYNLSNFTFDVTVK